MTRSNTSGSFRIFAFLTVVALLSGCASFAPPVHFDAVGEIRSFNAALIQDSPAQAAGKFRKMQKDLMSFNRGVNHVFYRFVRQTGLPARFSGPATSRVTLHGDFHVGNMGAYSSGGKVVVDLIDFDDSMQGPILLDVYRCASSLYIAARTDEMRANVVQSFVSSYMDTMGKIAAGDLSPDMVLDSRSEFALVGSLIHEAESYDQENFFTDFARCQMQEGKRVFGICDRYRKAPEGMAQALMQSYRACPVEGFTIQDAVVENGSGIGSAGSVKVLVLLRMASGDAADDVILEFKQEGVPAGMMFAAEQVAQQGQRVLDGESIMQTVKPKFIGIAKLDDKDFFVSELAAQYQELQWDKLVGFSQMTEAARLAGLLLAKGHARSTRESGAVAKEMAPLLGGNEKQFLSEVMQFCISYETFLRKAYEQFTRKLTSDPLL